MKNRDLFRSFTLVLTAATILLIVFAEYRRTDINSRVSECNDLQNDVQRTLMNVQISQLDERLRLIQADVLRSEARNSDDGTDRIKNRFDRLDEISLRGIEQIRSNESRILVVNGQLKRVENACNLVESDSSQANFALSFFYIMLSLLLFASGIFLSSPIVNLLDSDWYSRK